MALLRVADRRWLSIARTCGTFEVAARVNGTLEHGGQAMDGSQVSLALDRRDPEALARWQLSLVPGVGPRVFQGLVQQFGSALSALLASTNDRKEQLRGLRREVANEIGSSRYGELLDGEIRLCQKYGIRVFTSLDEAYPRMLAEIPDPPIVLYVRGDLLPSDTLAVGIVGTRHATLYGKRITERLAGSLSRAGLTVVSGLARGIDAVAHRTVLAANGRTLAVVAGGLLELYPHEHLELADMISERGAVISEMPLQCVPRRHAFPRRNRLISGMSLGVLVVEATVRSGALITARHAMEQGRDVFAVPGCVDQRASHGCHQLIRDGAKLVQTCDDVLEELGPLVAPTAASTGETICRVAELQLNPVERRVLQAISTDATRIERVVEQSGVAVHRVLATLSVLEMRRLIDRISGDLVARRP